MRNRLKISAALACAFLLAGAPFAAAATAPAPSPSSSASPSDASTDQVPMVTDGSNYGGNPAEEAALVASEDKRLVQVRTVSSIARWTGANTSVPYRVASGTGYTLVLPARVREYTIDDLLTLAPKTFVRQPDGAYLLSENLVVEAGATLVLNRPGALSIKMLSTPQKFVSIINYGGRMSISGTASSPALVTSWNTDSGTPRKVTDTGRAYIRSIGGTMAIEHAAFQDMGFWSGRTGGLSMTGSDRPVTGALDAMGAKNTQFKAYHSKKHPKGAAATPAATPEPAPEPGAVLEVPGAAPATPDANSPTSDYSYVTASVLDTTITGDAYGLFLANAVGASIHNVTIKDSRMDGIVLHRYVSNATIVDTTVSSSGLNGFKLSRASRAVRLDNVKAESNGRDGIYVDGRPLATGPSATGTALTSYGSNVVLVNNHLNANKHYGIEVRGGKTTTVASNTITGGQTGIVVTDSASGVTVTGNHLSQQSGQAIALRDGVTGTSVNDNTVSGGTVGIYLRNASAVVERNTLSGVTNHGVSAIGAAAIEVKGNIISGRGPSAVDLKRAQNAVSTRNTADNWMVTKSPLEQLVSFFQPLTILWTLLALILLFTAMAGHRHRGIVRHPYARQAPMSTFTDLAPILIQPDSIRPVESAGAKATAARRGRRRGDSEGPGTGHRTLELASMEAG